jgi:putative membrane protein
MYADGGRAMIPYLVLADLQNSVLAAILTFSDRVIYSAYEAVPRAQGFSALEDQGVAGVIMWVPGSLAFLLPVLWIVATMSPREHDRMATTAGVSADIKESKQG